MRELSGSLLAAQQASSMTPSLILELNTATRYTPPNGTYTEVANLTDLQNMNNDLDGWYRLTADIDASATSGWNGGAGFVPIGTSANRFTGVFDGNGHTISSLFINRSAISLIGLFGACGGDASFYDVTSTDCDITGNDYIGGLFGYISGDGTNIIYNCHVTGAITGDDVVGGLIGMLDRYSDEPEATSYIESCSFDGDVTGLGDIVGGFIGAIYGDDITSPLYFRFDNCFSAGTVTAREACGGFVAFSQYAEIWDCYTTSDITSDGLSIAEVGGFVGYDYEMRYTRCYCTGSINSGDAYYTGGFIGAEDKSTIIQCYSTSNITVPTGSIYVGGFIGYNYGGSTATDCYCINDVIGNDDTYNMAGFAARGLAVRCYCVTTDWHSAGNEYGFSPDYNGSGSSHDYYNYTLNPQDEDDEQGIRLTTAQMKSASSFETFDFGKVWGIDPDVNDGYPYLKMLQLDKDVITVVQWEQPLMDGATILLDNSDQYFKTKNFEGAKLVLGFGLEV